MLRGRRGAEVPCEGCVGCCVSSYPIPLRPADQVAIERVPEGYLTLPVGEGTARMGFREDGSCPLLVCGRCSVYADRPQTCRDYDCRLYSAAGLVPDGDRPVIEERVREWRFEYQDEAARQLADALRRAASFIREHAARFPPSLRAHSATAAAVLAVKVHALFADEARAQSVEQRVEAVLSAARAFDAGLVD